MPITLTQKERTLLEDAKTHEQICIDKYQQYASQAQSPQLKQIFQANEQSERTHLNSINQLLSGTVPQMNQQQGGQQAQQPAQQPQAQQNPMMAQQAQQPMPQQGLKSDKDLCTDMLMTEKYVSGSYDTSIFEFTNTNMRDVLNHIQKEEQKHGESISQYMIANGLYAVQ